MRRRRSKNGRPGIATPFRKDATWLKSGRNFFRAPRHMIRLDNISKPIGHQILFIEASAALQKGEKIGLVGPNGAGKTTLFRMITGRELRDDGQVAVARRVTMRYFSPADVEV